MPGCILQIEGPFDKLRVTECFGRIKAQGDRTLKV